MSDSFRDYDKSDIKNSVENTYKNMLCEQTLDNVVEIMKNTFTGQSDKYDIWELINKLNTIVDESDPDTDLPQIVHFFQTAEEIRNKYIQPNYFLKNIPIKSLFTQQEWYNVPEKFRHLYNTSIDQLYSHIKYWDWFILVGFIHDFGKILFLDEFGKLPQHFTVGDTFPLGSKLNKNYVYHDKGYHKHNPDLAVNIYLDECGFDNVIFSWGHDEYLAKILERNFTYLPKEAIYIIRYHSFYSWHSPSNGIRGYTHLANDMDWYMLPLLKCFQKADLYSKSDIYPSPEHMALYNAIIEKYIPGKELYIPTVVF